MRVKKKSGTRPRCREESPLRRPGMSPAPPPPSEWKSRRRDEQERLWNVRATKRDRKPPKHRGIKAAAAEFHERRKKDLDFRDVSGDGSYLSGPYQLLLWACKKAEVPILDETKVPRWVAVLFGFHTDFDNYRRRRSTRSPHAAALVDLLRRLQEDPIERQAMVMEVMMDAADRGWVIK